MLLDIHVHTAKYSPCSSLDLYDAAIKARAVGLDGICITDHDTDAAKTEAARVVRETGLRIFVGMEIQTHEGDLLVFGLPEPPGMIMYAAALLAKVAAAGGTAIAAHPFRDNERGLGEYILQLPGLGGVEVLNGRTTKAGNARAKPWLPSMGLPAWEGVMCITWKNSVVTPPLSPAWWQMKNSSSKLFGTKGYGRSTCSSATM